MAIDLQEMALAQIGDPELILLQSETTSLIQQEIPLPSADVNLICDMSTGKRSFVAERFQCSVFNILHGLSHHGIRATQKPITTHY